MGKPGRPCSSLRVSSVSAPNSQRSVMPFRNPRWHMIDNGEQRFFRLPFGSAPASRRARATDQCCPTRATNSGVCALTSRMSILAPAWTSSSTQFLCPAENWIEDYGLSSIKPHSCMMTSIFKYKKCTPQAQLFRCPSSSIHTLVTHSLS